jgi:transposase
MTTIRLMLTEALWGRLAPLLPPQKPRTGRPPLDHRRFLEAGLWLARTGAPWRDLPSELINRRTAWRRLQRWTAAGIWGRIIDALRAMAADAGWDAHLLDSSVIRAHAQAAGARRAAGKRPPPRRLLDQAPPALRRPRPAGHAPPHRRRAPRPDRRRAAVRARRPAHRPAYSAAWLLDAFRRKRIVPVIPSRANQPENPDFDREVYRGRNLVERLVGKLKQFRRVATRYDKLDPH